MSILDQLSELVSPLGGMISRVERLTSNPGEPALSVAYAKTGDLANIFDYVRMSTSGGTAGEMDGTGSDMGPESASISALAEALERYSSAVYRPEQFIWATGRELGAEALDLDLIPRCSENELAHPKCLLRLPDKLAPIRWVRGVSLMTRKPVWIPAVMVYHYFPHMSLGERFWFPISTGCAAHTTYEQALVSGICEVVERDAISLLWLQMMALPEIDLSSLPEEAWPYIEKYRLSHVSIRLFDATTDIGIPTAYGVILSPYNQQLATMVACSTDLDPVRAVIKVAREAVPARLALQVPRPRPESTDDFLSVFHGATYMGAPERQAAFRFLLDSEPTRSVSEMPRLESGNSGRNLELLLRQLKDKGFEAFAVDLTTDESLRVGIRVVRVIIPGLQPLSFSPRAQFLGHPRLYEAPRLMGHPSRTEANLNPNPQPFA